MAVKTNKINRGQIDTNLVVDPGFGRAKIAVPTSNGGFSPALFPTVVGMYNSSVAGTLDGQTIKVTIKSSTRPDLVENSCRLVGNKAKLHQATGRLSAFRFDKSDKEIITWIIFAAYSYIIPAGIKKIQIHKSWLGCLLQNLEEVSSLKQAIAGEHIFELERIIDGTIDIVTVDLKLTEERIFVLQEASCAIHYVKDNDLCPISSEDGIEVGNVSIGVGTVDFVRQSISGEIVEIHSTSLGVSSLASLVCNQLSASKLVKNPSEERVLDVISEKGEGNRLFYGRGNSAIDISDTFATCLQNWSKNIVAEYMQLWKTELEWIDRVFFYGGGVHLLGLKSGNTPKIVYLFPQEHNPQFVDVWGAKIYLDSIN